ncbi:MAG: hypothetical protein ACK4SF_04520 [Algoriphagus aquaeductus]|uniref:hypothetical protein n=1 Tax=Algoriphagus aquaeductus TaxID=475299 RepID=UPI00391AE0C8
MENLIKQFEKESGISATIESDLYADGEIYTKEYTEWLEKRIQALSMSGVVVSSCDHSDTYPLNQKYSKCRKCGGCIED